jgi:predicted component of type VI protein secretion system
VIERRLAVIAESGERRVLILRDAIADFAAAELAKRDEEIVNLKKQLADLQQKLEQQSAINQRVHDVHESYAELDIVSFDVTSHGATIPDCAPAKVGSL